MAANSASVNIGNNPLRHSILFFSDAPGVITVNGIAFQIPNPQLTSLGYIYYNWDEFGDAFTQISKIQSGAASVAVVVLEQYREEAPVEQ